MQAFLRDVRYGVRSLRHHPALTAVAVIALTLGIGLTTTMFSIVYGAMMKGLPYPEGDRIMVIRRMNLDNTNNRQGEDLPIQDFVDYKTQQRSFVDLAAFTNGTVNVSGTEKAERFDGSWITSNTFDLLGAQPLIGRGFRSGEDAPGG